MLSLDTYRNRVTNKIVAYPTGNLHQWAMVNLGKVIITGLDLSADGNIHLSKTSNLLLGVNYTYQSALDKTDPSKSTYNQIIHPRHLIRPCSTASPWFDMAYTLWVVKDTKWLQQQRVSNE